MPPAANYVDTGLLSATSYSYRVQAIDTAGNTSAFSNTATATTQAGQGPTAPSNLSAAAASGSQIDLSWAASTSNVGLANYIVQRCQGTGCTNFAQIAKPAGTTYNDTGLLANTSYSYRVQAIDTAGNTSPVSSIASATTGYVLPLKASSNNRYLVDQNGTHSEPGRVLGPGDGPMVRWRLQRDLGIAISEFWAIMNLLRQATTTTEIRIGCWCCTYKTISPTAVV